MQEQRENLIVSFENGIKRVTFNRPQRRNSVNAEIMPQMLAAFKDSATDGTRVVVLTGAGDSFCAGADLNATNERDIANFNITDALREGVNPIILAMRNLPAPIIARVHGHAVGVGFNYALACDLIIASEQALFGQVFVKIGLMPDGGSTNFLPRLVGYHKAFELAALGDIIKADEALRLGIINKVVPFEELDKTIDETARRFLQLPQVALEKIKAGLNFGMNADLSAALDFEAVNQDACYHSPDFNEGVTAFLEKRKPVFNAVK